MESATIRQTFLQFFADRGHEIVPSAPLIPRHDPTLFFTNAGMVPFKRVFTGEETRAVPRAASAQKCLRVSGKHNDLENVGVTPRHHTFFEMLGNFSFGDYFKTTAIRYAWELVTEVFRIDADKLWVSVFEDDDESHAIWRDEVGFPEARLVRLGPKDNFWAMGDTGPCGPCSEIHLDLAAHRGERPNPAGLVADPEGYLEFWNLVFMQYERSADGSLSPLPRPSIDTGMGLERMACILQGKDSNYETDVFQPIIQEIASLSGHPYGASPEHDVSMQVIADHARATTFLIADGIMPSNEERGYVLRRIMRRAIRHGVKLGLKAPFMDRAVDRVIDRMADAFPELRERRAYIEEVVRHEESRFNETLEKGLKLYHQEADRLSAAGRKTLSGDFAFRLADTYGFPLDLTQLIAAEDGLEVDEDGYRAALEAQRARGRSGWKGSGEAAVAGIYRELLEAKGPTRFIGYEDHRSQATIQAILVGGAKRGDVSPGEEAEIIVDRTPFYAESGGQIADTGTIEGLASPSPESGGGGEGGEHACFQVSDVRAPIPGLFVHFGRMKAGTLRVGDVVQLVIEEERRAAIRRNHTATHLLHAALKRVLGDHVAQRGSLVAPDRLRFDFSHFKPLTDEEIAEVEDVVYQEILRNTALDVRERRLEDAMAEGVVALFGEKYGDRVRVVKVPGFSAELCGGTHVRRTGDIGAFKIISESNIQAGVRRVEAVTGWAILKRLRDQERHLRALAASLNASSGDLEPRLHKLLDEKRHMEKTIAELKRKMLEGTGAADTIQDRTKTIEGIPVLSLLLEDVDAKSLREAADRYRNRLGSGVVCLGTRQGPKATLLVALTKDLTSRLSAGDIIKAWAPRINGGGGGRRDMAQAGGRSPERLETAMDEVYEIVRTRLRSS